jgi:hypothetical protein
MPGARVKFGILVSYLALAACLFDKLRSPGTVSSVLMTTALRFSMKVISWVKYSLSDASGVEFVH